MPIDDSYPVRLSVERPERFSRSHVGMRLAILVALSLLGAFAWLATLIYFAVPIVTAAFVSRDGREKFQAEHAARLRRWIHWIVAFDAYFTFLTDRFPNELPEETAAFTVEPAAAPTTGNALLRLVTSIPSAFVLALLWIAAAVTTVVAGVFILFREDYPEALYNFHLAVVRWGARLLAYHASLTAAYPPFDLDMTTPPTTHPGAPTAVNHPA
ncbi:MAG: DUF4389 domain-containing protein [Dehalococcoidia bacterium]